MIHEMYMRRAIELAKKAEGWTSPNPMVGAVIVKDDRIIGEGYHERCGQLHAERNALASLSESAEGSTMYVTLEPCCHWGRTPPCTEAIIENKIKRVYVGSRDPNPLVAGKGVSILRENGIEVIEDFLKNECDDINSVFFKYITTGKPYVVLKYAMTIDGKIATGTGKSKWITGEEAREHVHRLRGKYSAIMAGIGTVLADDPMLNCRIEGKHQPLRIVLDSNLKIPIDSQLVNTAKEYPLMIVCAHENEKAEALRKLGADVLAVPDNDGHINICELMAQLGKRKIDSVLVEGGGDIHEACIRAGEADHICAYIAPKIFGGRNARTPVGGVGIDDPIQCAMLNEAKIKMLGQDILLEFDVIRGFEKCLQE